MLRNRILAFSVVCVLGLVVAASVDPALAGKCDEATVQDAYPADHPPLPKEKQTAETPVTPIKLFKTVEVKVSALPQLNEVDCRTKKLVVYLNGIAFSKLAPYIYDREKKLIRFEFKPYPVADNTWATILGQPNFDARPIRISMGLEGETPFKYGIEKQPELLILDTPWVVVWGVLFLLLLVLFWLCAKRTNIIRDGSPTEYESGKTAAGTFSLAKSQGAWWFFIILSTYLFIGLVTGQFASSINSTALILLGIGAGTVLGSAIVDTQKDTAGNAVQAEAAKTKLDTDIKVLSGKASLTAPETTELIQKKSEREKLARRSENFFTDILSDANGVNFHRFQMFAWTIVLSLVFVKAVYESLAMPIFDTTLMGLLGLSAGTYLGLKVPEPTVPK